jgi:hypothetical protein
LSSVIQTPKSPAASANYYPYSYEGLIGQIKAKLEKKSPEHWQKFTMLLGWLLYAAQPLKLHEIQSILAFRPESSSVDFNSKTMQMDILESCGSLFYTLAGDGVHPVHQSLLR